MTPLAGILVLGIGLGFLPWRPVAMGLGVLTLGIVVCWLGGVAVVFVPFGILTAPALLLGWACGLLIMRTRAERAAR